MYILMSRNGTTPIFLWYYTETRRVCVCVCVCVMYVSHRVPTWYMSHERNMCVYYVYNIKEALTRPSENPRYYRANA